MDTPIATATLKALRRILRETDLGGRRLANATGMTPSQMLVLQEVARRGETTPTVIAQRLQFSQATVTNIVDRLCALDYLTRQRAEHDRRQVLLHPTDAGRAVLDTAPDLLQKRFVDCFSDLPAWEQAMILAGLERLGELLGAEDMDAAPLLDGGVIDRGYQTPHI